MLNAVILVFIGGAVGAILREFLMLMVRNPIDGFPMDILTANLIAAFLLGLVTAQHARKAISDNVNTLLGTGVMGGLSTFSSFAYGSYVLMTSPTERGGLALLYTFGRRGLLGGTLDVLGVDPPPTSFAGAHAW